MNFDSFLDAVGLKAVSGSDRYVAIYLVFETSTHHNNLDFSHRHTLSLRQVASHWEEIEVRRGYEVRCQPRQWHTSTSMFWILCMHLFLFQMLGLLAQLG